MPRWPAPHLEVLVVQEESADPEPEGRPGPAPTASPPPTSRAHREWASALLLEATQLSLGACSSTHETDSLCMRAGTHCRAPPICGSKASTGSPLWEPPRTWVPHHYGASLRVRERARPGPTPFSAPEVALSSLPLAPKSTSLLVKAALIAELSGEPTHSHHATDRGPSLSLMVAFWGQEQDQNLSECVPRVVPSGHTYPRVAKNTGIRIRSRMLHMELCDLEQVSEPLWSSSLAPVQRVCSSHCPLEDGNENRGRILSRCSARPAWDMEPPVGA